MTLAVPIAVVAMLLPFLQPDEPSVDFPALADGDVLVLGEMHGSREIPQYFLELLRRAVRRTDRRHPVTVGLELSPSSAGMDCRSDPSRPLPPSWTRAAQDGRSSQAMRGLLCALQVSHRYRIVYLDDEERGEDFDRRAAERFREALTANHGIGLILTGNFHARNNAGSLAAHLRGLGAVVHTVTVSAPAADTWICSGQTGACGVHRSTINFCSSDPADRLELRWRSVQIPGFQWDYCLSMPRLTPSEPAMAIGGNHAP